MVKIWMRGYVPVSNVDSSLGGGTQISNPIKVFPDQKFCHLSMVGVLHCDSVSIKMIFTGESSNAFRIIVSHQKVTTQGCGDFKQSFVIEDVVGVEALSRLLARRGVPARQPPFRLYSPSETLQALFQARAEGALTAWRGCRVPITTQ